MRDLARRRATGADCVDHAAGSGRAEPIEVRRLGGFDAGPTAERCMRAVGQAVEQEDDDRVHYTGTRCSERITRTTPGGTSDSQAPPVRIASLTSIPEISLSVPSSRMTTS